MKKYILIKKESEYTLNQEVINNEKKKDGLFGIITNVKSMSAAEILSNYKELWRIEDAFGEMKGILKSRPMFHWTDQRIIGHLMLCFLSHFYPFLRGTSHQTIEKIRIITKIQSH